MADLEQTGAELVLKGLDDFRSGLTTAISGLNSLRGVLNDLATTSTTAGTTTDKAVQQITNSYQNLSTVLREVRESAVASQQALQSVSKIEFLPNRNALGQFSGGAPQQARVVNPQTTQQEEAHLELLVGLLKEVEAGELAAGQAAAQQALNVAKNVQALQQEAAATQVLVTQAKEVTTQINGIVKAQNDLDSATRRVSIQTEAEQVANLAAKAREGAVQLEKLAQAQRDLDTATQKASAEKEATQVNELASRAGAASKQLELLAQAQRDFDTAAARQSAIKQADSVDLLRRQAEALYPAQEKASGSSLGFVRAITALVSASNLLGVSGNNAVLNTLTLGASFDRLGVKGLLLGGSIGVVLASIGTLVGAYNNIVTAGENVIKTVVDVTGALVKQAVDGFQAAIKGAGDYQQELAFTVALLQPTQQQMGELNQKIEDVSRSSVFGLGKAAEAVNELARAGVSLTDIVGKGALDAVIALATAANGELNLGDAAKAVTGIVGSYTQVVNGALKETVSFKEATDALTGTAQLSRLSFNEVITAWRQAAPIAASTKISVQDLGTVIAVLANAGESASISGTSLKQVILDLEKPSQNAAKLLNDFGVSLFTTDGKIRPFRDVIIDMNKAFGEQALKEGKVTEEEQKHALAVIFGARAAIAANIITNQGAEAFDKMAQSMKDVTAIDMANILVLPLNARLTILKNNVETLATAFAGPLVAGFSDAVNAGILFLQSIPIEDVRKLGQAFVAVATGEGIGTLKKSLEEIASGPALDFFNSLIDVGSKVRDAFINQILPAVLQVGQRFVDWATSAGTIGSVTDKIERLGNAIGFVATVVANSITDIANWVGAIVSNQEAMDKVRFIIEGLAVTVGATLVASFVAVAVPMKIVIDLLEQLGKAVDPLIQSYVALGLGTKKSADDVAASNKEIADGTEQMVSDVSKYVVGSVKSLDPLAEAYTNTSGAVVEATQVINDANVGIVVVQGKVVQAIQSAQQEVVQTYADTASAVNDLNEAQTQDMVDTANNQVKVQAEGWDNIVDVTKTGVKNTSATIGELDDVYDNFSNQQKNAVPLVEQVWQGIADAIGSAVRFIIDRFSDLGNFLINSGVGQFLGFAIETDVKIIPAFAIGHAVIDSFDSIKRSAEDLDNRLKAIPNITIPEINTDFTKLGANLRTIIDGIGARADEARARVDALRATAGASTEGGDYPVKEPKTPKGRQVQGPEVAFNKALDQAEEFSNDLSDKIQKAGLQAIEKLEDIFRKAADATVIAYREYLEKRDEVIRKANEAGDKLFTDLEQRRQERAEQQQLDHLLRLETQTRTFGRQDRDNRISDARETEDRVQSVIQRAIDHGFELQQHQRDLQRSRLRENEDIAYKRAEDDEEHHQQRLEALRNKQGTRQTQEDLAKIRSQVFNTGGFTLAPNEDAQEAAYQRTLARQRANEDKDRTRTRSRQDEDTQYEEGNYIERTNFADEQEARRYENSVRRRNEDRTRSRQDVLDDVVFEDHQQEVRQSHQDNIEILAANRRAAEITTERDARLAILDRELAETNDKIRASANEQARAVLGTLGNTLQDVERQIKDKAPEIVKAGGDAMAPVMEAIVANLELQMTTVFDAAHKARLELEAVSNLQGTNVPPVPAPTPSVAPVSGTAGTTTGAATSAASQYVGTSGSPYTTGQVGDLPGTTQIVVPSGTGTTTVNNVTNYNVDANYADTQSPISIRQDLTALAMVGRR
jgi:TP901 family phage tail tape measure protein